ncbi:hypothetical protein [Thalassococcus sp. S3]|uniref:hypothetical protein n=1 Tax=Thalassococcus sp. S3 TaxID=2017482 RepID=UPI00102439E6|nr:hypothetical protein [Thalassococcus sp. S3]QBF32337.1 hypothetical protein CFI11_14100 [Thalassococcus sp. S3]
MSYPQQSLAEGFTGAEFATWSEASQNSYIETSVTMAGVVFTQTHLGKASCVNDWYFADDAWKTRNSDIRDAIAAYRDAHPSGVILALIIRECGALD